jgi:hypothetical protein
MGFKRHMFSPVSTSRGAEATDGKWPGTAVVSRLKPRRLMQGRAFSKTFSPKLSTTSIALVSTINLSTGSVLAHQTTCVPKLPTSSIMGCVRYLDVSGGSASVYESVESMYNSSWG